MAKPTIQEILSTLPSLDPDEWVDIKDKCSYWLSHQGIKDDDPKLDRMDYILLGLIGELQRQGLPCPPMHRLPMCRGMKEFKAAVPELLEFFDRTVPKISRVELTSLCGIGYRELAFHLDKIHITIGVTVLLRHSKRMPEFICQAFPGYAEAGILHQVVLANRVGRSP